MHVCMFMYVYIYIYVYVYLYVYKYIYIYIYIHDPGAEISKHEPKTQPKFWQKRIFRKLSGIYIYIYIYIYMN